MTPFTPTCDSSHTRQDIDSQEKGPILPLGVFCSPFALWFGTRFTQRERAHRTPGSPSSGPRLYIRRSNALTLCAIRKIQ